jgi:hypothetical protein
MSNGEQWRSYVSKDEAITKIEAFLGNPVPTSSYLGQSSLQFPLEKLMQDTDYNKAPTTEWYTLHMCVQEQQKWVHRPLAWGLNRKRLDMYKLQ